MGKTRVVNIGSVLGRGAKDVIYIGRAGHGHDGYFGNPFPLSRRATKAERAQCIENYRVYFANRLRVDADFKRRINELKGKTLGCFCKPLACHGDVIAEYLDRDDVPGPKGGGHLNGGKYA